MAIYLWQRENGQLRNQLSVWQLEILDVLSNCFVQEAAVVSDELFDIS